MNKIQCQKLLASALFLGSIATSANEFSANAGITNNYIWRGVSQSDDGISVSGGLDYNNDSGLYAGTWLATVDFNDDTNFEFDLYGGYQKTLSNVTLDIGYIYYGYQGEDNLAFSEAYVKASIESFTFGVSTLLDSDAGGGFADSSYFEVAYDIELTKEVSMTLHAGHFDFEDSDSYQDYNVSLSHGDFSLMVSTLEGNKTLEDTLVSLSYSTSFDL